MEQEIMKKVNKKIKLVGIIYFIIGGLVFGSIGVAFAINYKASDITYNPSDTSWNVVDVKSAIDDLKNDTNTTITDLNRQLDLLKNKEITPKENFKVSSMGDSSSNRPVSQNLTKKGIYIVSVGYSYSSILDRTNDQDWDDYINLYCSNSNCEISRLNSYSHSKTASVKIISSSYSYNYFEHAMFYVKANSPDTLVAVESGTSNDNKAVQTISMQLSMLE